MEGWILLYLSEASVALWALHILIFGLVAKAIFTKEVAKLCHYDVEFTFLGANYFAQ